jgi:hypothetical protein
MTRFPDGYTVRKVYLIACHECNQDITRSLDGRDCVSAEDARALIWDHRRTWHSEQAKKRRS